MRIDVTRDVFLLAQEFTISRGSRTEARVLTARVSDGTHTGWGECVPYARYGETLESVAAQVEGLPGDVTREALYELLEPGAARNAVDCALWDLEAKQAGKRVWELAGLAKPGPEITAYTLSLDTPEHMQADAALAREVRRHLKHLSEGTSSFEIEYQKQLEALKEKNISVLKKHPAAYPEILATSSIKDIGIAEFRATISAQQG